MLATMANQCFRWIYGSSTSVLFFQYSPDPLLWVYRCICLSYLPWPSCFSLILNFLSTSLYLLSPSFLLSPLLTVVPTVSFHLQLFFHVCFNFHDYFSFSLSLKNTHLISHCLLWFKQVFLKDWVGQKPQSTLKNNIYAFMVISQYCYRT